MDKILEVKKMSISFRTTGGILKAVRNVSFDLERGKTLAIVGESGSGKSVSSKAILGILAGNSIIENGEILYDGKDLLKISEDEMYKIRGDKISMIFQDPLSSLNPIVKIGKQITEAMLLKSKAKRRESRRELHSLELLLKREIAASGVGGNADAMVSKFVKWCRENAKSEKMSADAAAYDDAEFKTAVAAAAKHSYVTALEKKRRVLLSLEKAKAYYEGEFDKKGAKKYATELKGEVEASIDRLEIIKDSAAYTFGGSLASAIDKYYYYIKFNPKEEARFEKQTKKRERLIAKGKNVDWKVVPKATHDTDELKESIVSVIERLIERYEDYIAESETVDFDARGEEILSSIVKNAQGEVYHLKKSEAKTKAIELMTEVGIREPEKRFYQYPFEFSGGMRQRIVIAIALAADPDILICDEPTTALDVTIQSQILELINKLKKERGLSIIFITHDLGVVANMADDIAVMYAGKIVEYGTADDIYYDPRHPYTWALLSSMPDLDTNEKLDAIPGTPPNMIYPPVGDAFAERNKYALKIDFEMQPPMFKISETHSAATWLLHPNAPKVEVPSAITGRIERMKKRIEENEHESDDVKMGGAL